jgi:hypothetical protein
MTSQGDPINNLASGSGEPSSASPAAEIRERQAAEAKLHELMETVAREKADLSADRNLYSAKRAGRNRVHLPDREPAAP